ncbi:rSAM/selenodomain-associated transferase 2 [Hymenobacter sp. UYAg731]
MSPTPLLSVIIPTLNEAHSIAATLAHLHATVGAGVAYEVLVSDGGSTDATLALAAAHGARALPAPKPGRAAQLNFGASQAHGTTLYFLHADTLPPAGFGQLIRRYQARSYRSGCFRLRFDLRHPVLLFSGWCSRFNAPAFQFGDQSLFVEKALFDQLGGFNEQMLLMEDVDLPIRIKHQARFVVMPQSVVTSARKYVTHGVLRTELTHLAVQTLFLAGTPQPTLLRVYRRLLQRRRPRRVRGVV